VKSQFYFEACLPVFEGLSVGWLAICLMFGSAIGVLAEANIAVQADGAGRSASPMLYGIFVEDWSHQVEGGIYGEMIRNRSFDDAQSAKEALVAGFAMNLPDTSSSSSGQTIEIPAWRLVNEVPDAAIWGVDQSRPLNDNNHRCLKLEIHIASDQTGVYNVGWQSFQCGVGQRRRLRKRACRIFKSGHQFGRAGGTVAGRRRQVLRQFLERTHGRHCGQERSHQKINKKLMKILAIDIGGTHVKILATGQKEKREFESGRKLTPKLMVAGVQELAKVWEYDVVSIGYPGPVLRNRPVAEPHNLAKGWVGFNFEKAFKRPVKVINDAAMQALGSYKKGKLLFLGFGTGLGTTMIVDGFIEPMELGHLPYKKATYEDYVGLRGLEKYGKKKWRKYVADVVEKLAAALEPDDIVLGGGNVHKLKELPPGCRAGDNANAFTGGFRLWENTKS
jgi:polyphosphate glucokinase